MLPRSLMATPIFILVLSGAATAQERELPSEEIEPRIVGGRGTTSLGIAGFLNGSFSSEQALPTTFIVQLDAARFVTERVAVRFGVAGDGRIRGEAVDEEGLAASALHAIGGFQFHFTPRSILSAYAGADYSMQLTQRAGGERGTILAKFGIIGAVSSRAGFFIEGGYGARLTRGDEGELITRATAQVGIRIKL
jgi:hypothetical protein